MNAPLPPSPSCYRRSGCCPARTDAFDLLVPPLWLFTVGHCVNHSPSSGFEAHRTEFPSSFSNFLAAPNSRTDFSRFVSPLFIFDFPTDFSHALSFFSILHRHVCVRRIAMTNPKFNKKQRAKLRAVAADRAPREIDGNHQQVDVVAASQSMDVDGPPQTPTTMVSPSCKHTLILTCPPTEMPPSPHRQLSVLAMALVRASLWAAEGAKGRHMVVSFGRPFPKEVPGLVSLSVSQLRLFVERQHMLPPRLPGREIAAYSRPPARHYCPSLSLGLDQLRQVRFDRGLSRWGQGCLRGLSSACLRGSGEQNGQALQAESFLDRRFGLNLQFLTSVVTGNHLQLTGWPTVIAWGSVAGLG